MPPAISLKLGVRYAIHPGVQDRTALLQSPGPGDSCSPRMVIGGDNHEIVPAVRLDAWNKRKRLFLGRVHAHGTKVHAAGNRVSESFAEVGRSHGKERFAPVRLTGKTNQYSIHPLCSQQGNCAGDSRPLAQHRTLQNNGGVCVGRSGFRIHQPPTAPSGCGEDNQESHHRQGYEPQKCATAWEKRMLRRECTIRTFGG